MSENNSFGKVRWHAYVSFALAICLILSSLVWITACQKDSTVNPPINTTPQTTTPTVTTPEGTTDPEGTPDEDLLVSYKVTVVDQNNAPVAGATVQLYVGDKSLTPAFTNEDGTVEILAQEADYTVDATRAGYVFEKFEKVSANEFKAYLAPNGYDPLCYQAEAGVTEEALKADIASLLELPEGTEFEIQGEFDLTVPGKYSITCVSDNKEQQVEIWVYDNYVNAFVNGNPVTGDTVSLNYKEAAASKNFTNIITITDSIGNALPFVKDGRCMSFENTAGSYLMYYNVTDAAGQTFSVRIVYEVAYLYNMVVANGAALTFAENATFAADFDGATDVWLEDADGKIDSALYEIEKDAVVLKQEYYNDLVGRKVAIKVCTDNGETHFYVSVYNQENYDDFLRKNFENMVICQSSASFRYVEEAPAGIDFAYGYRYIKASGTKVEDTAVQIRTLGKYGRISFDLYVNKSTNSSGNKDMEFQIVNGAKFISVVDSKGNSLPVNDKNGKPHVMLTTGGVYHIVLDINESLNPTFYIWGGRSVDLYYYNFELGEPEYTYVLDDAHQSVICYKGEEQYGYFAWPTVTKLDGKRLMAVSSGMRNAHIDIEGKVVCWFSEDEGKTWSEPYLLADTVLDDRDAGVVYWNGKIIVSWFCASKEYFRRQDRDKYADWALGIPDDLDTKLMGGNYIISEDGGRTWSDIYNMPEGMFTPHGLIINPDGGLTSVGYLKYDKVNGRWGTGIAVRTTDGTMDENGFVWSEAIVIADSDTQYSWDFQEPFGIYNDEGVLIVIMRADKGLYQCELQPGADKFGEWRKIANVQESPAHMFQHSSGVMVMTYGYRGIYVDPNTGNTVSYTERAKDVLGIRARLSYDGGLTWTREIVLTTDARVTDDNLSDLGYTSSVEISDGKIVTVYYQRNKYESRAGIYQVVWELPEALTGDITITLAGGKTTGSNNTDVGDGLLIGTVTGQVGEAIELPEPTKAGYTFAGWYMDYACTMPFVGETYCNNITLYAKWVKN